MDSLKTMTPYSLESLGQAIIDQARKEGLTVAEDAVEVLGKAVYEATMGWVQRSAELSENKIDDIVVPFLAHFDSYVLPQIEKLDLDADGD